MRQLTAARAASRSVSSVVRSHSLLRRRRLRPVGLGGFRGCDGQGGEIGVSRERFGRAAARIGRERSRPTSSWASAVATARSCASVQRSAPSARPFGPPRAPAPRRPRQRTAAASATPHTGQAPRHEAPGEVGDGARRRCCSRAVDGLRQSSTASASRAASPGHSIGELGLLRAAAQLSLEFPTARVTVERLRRSPRRLPRPEPDRLLGGLPRRPAPPRARQLSSSARPRLRPVAASASPRRPVPAGPPRPHPSRGADDAAAVATDASCSSVPYSPSSDHEGRARPPRHAPASGRRRLRRGQRSVTRRRRPARPRLAAYARASSHRRRRVVQRAGWRAP